MDDMTGVSWLRDEDSDLRSMLQALEEARAAADQGEVPVGAIIVHPEKGLVARARNAKETLQDPTAHAEILAIGQAAEAVGSWRLENCTLYSTLEPCPMCATAISFARIRRLYFGASDSKGGGVENGPRIFDQPTCHHRPDVYGGIGEADAAALLKSFFADRR